MQVDEIQAAELLKKSDGILILCHQKPDGDTLGSGFALFLALRALGKQVWINCSDGFPNRYAFLYPDFAYVPPAEFVPKTVVAVDIADPQLLGTLQADYGEKIDLCIDHHPSNTQYARHLLLDVKAAGTVEIICRVIDALNVPFNTEIATCIYTGLATDTGCFRYSNTTVNTHLVAARMMGYGIDFFMVNKRMFETKSVARMELERRVMDTLEYYADKKVAFMVVTREAIEQTGVPEDDLEGISSIPRQIEGVDVAVTFQEKFDGVYRISMRSSEQVNSSQICEKLGGGGHACAAGCTIEGSIEDAKNAVLEQLKLIYREL